MDLASGSDPYFPHGSTLTSQMGQSHDLIMALGDQPIKYALKQDSHDYPIMKDLSEKPFSHEEYLTAILWSLAGCPGAIGQILYSSPVLEMEVLTLERNIQCQIFTGKAPQISPSLFLPISPNRMEKGGGVKTQKQMEESFFCPAT